MIAKAQEKGVIMLLLPTDTVAATAEFAADAEMPAGVVSPPFPSPERHGAARWTSAPSETVSEINVILRRRPWRRHRGVERPHGRVFEFDHGHPSTMDRP